MEPFCYMKFESLHEAKEEYTKMLKGGGGVEAHTMRKPITVLRVLNSCSSFSGTVCLARDRERYSNAPTRRESSGQY